MIKAADLVEKFKLALANHWGYIWGTAGVEWTAAKQKQKVNYMISNYGEDWKKNADAKNSNYYMAALYGDKWIGHVVADCSGLFAWAFKQLGGAIAHGSNSIYANYCTTKGKLTSEIRKTLPPGAAVFVDKSGNKSHIGLYAGDGKVIEAQGTQAGVCTSNLSANKWSYYGLLKNVSYPAQDAANQPSAPSDDISSGSSLPTLKRGMKGEYVTLLQTKLKNQGYSLGSCGVDGDFGSATEKAVKQFQKDHGLTVDGVVGSKTWAALENGTPVQYYTVTITHLTDAQAHDLAAKYSNATVKKEG